MLANATVKTPFSSNYKALHTSKLLMCNNLLCCFDFTEKYMLKIDNVLVFDLFSYLLEWMACLLITYDIETLSYFSIWQYNYNCCKM